MSNVPAIPRNAHAKLLLLRTLRDLNRDNKLPTATALARAVDDRNTIPHRTLAARRTLIRGMRTLNLIGARFVPRNPFEVLYITQTGLDALEELDGTKR